MMTSRKLTAAVVALVLILALTGCSGGDTKPSEPAEDSGTTEINPQTPVDNAEETVDDANDVTDDQTSEINELTDDE